MRPMRQAVELFRTQLGVEMDPNAKTVEEQWAFLSGFHTGLTGQADVWRVKTLTEAVLWEAGVRAARVGINLNK